MAAPKMTWFVTTLTFVVSLYTVCAQVLTQPPSLISAGPYVIEVSDQFGSTLTLPCVASGTPKPTYSWYYNGQPYTGQVQPVSDGTLIFQNVNQALSGYYQCFAKNSVGTAMSNTTQVIVARQASFQDSSGTGIPKTVTLNSAYSLQCNPLSSSIPAPRATTQAMDYSWQYQSQFQPVLLNTRVQIDSSGSLNYAYAQQSDGSPDPICCKIKNRIVGVEVEGSCFTVSVTGPTAAPTVAPMFYPNMTENPGGKATTVLALEGKDRSLRVFFGGSSGIQYSWERLGTPLPTDGRVLQLSNNIELAFTRIQKSDQGTYVCHGSVPGGQPVDVSVNLIVKSAPRFLDSSSQPRDINATVGSDVIIMCSPYAEPDASIQWFKNGISFVPSTTPGFSVSNNGRTLTVNSVCKDKCPTGGNSPMVIQCNASNAYGYAFANGYINVFVKTLLTMKPQSVLAKFGETMNFTAQATTDPVTPLTYSWYFTPSGSGSGTPPPERMLGSSDKYNISISPDRLTTILSVYNIDTSMIGDYRIVAANGVDFAEHRFSISQPPAAASLWWVPIVIIIPIVILVILLIFLICYCLRRNRGDEYPVDQKEREADRDPVKELSDSGFQDFVRGTHDIERQPLTN